MSAAVDAQGRLGASLVLAARDRGFPRGYAELTVLDAWYAHVSMDAVEQHFRKDRDVRSRLLKAEKRARTQTSDAVVPKLTTAVDGRRKIKDNPPIIFHLQLAAAEFKKEQSGPHQAIPKSVAGGA